MALITYLRVSTNDQTIENQRRQIQDAGYQVERDFEFYDDGISGAVPASKRPALDEAMKMARKGDVFVVVAIDRLGRDAVDVLTTVKALDSKGVKVVSLREGFDLSTPAGKMMLHMMAGFAEMEKSLIAERRDAGISRAKAEGVHCGRPQFEHGEFIASLWDSGLSYSQIVSELAGKGIKAGKTTIYRFKK
ncbi:MULTISPECIES: recombinase family protein [Scandinavium]|uniref:Recombinase family protein n=1 Tax=Scandinavium hiltneri TaxID=2926519 RepID=A0ABT2E734_9ENTR|nr:MULTISPECIES: recombinase family protein [Scandinavium]MCS2150756.1 recombinase family protein [Scandinavium manionii]MCS2163698.1 recombinase family protein [Scandinavium hiltneri]MCS2166977.1 recombinase family protein [Scandinavium manionii]